MKINRVTRIVNILTALRAEKEYSVDDLAEMSETSRRTIFRDLKELQALGVKYTYNAKTGGYTMGDGFFLKSIALDLQESLSLLLLVHKASKQIQLPFRNSAMRAALKIEDHLPRQIRQYCNITLKNISVKPNPQAPMNPLDSTFAQLQKAIARKRKVNIMYNSFFEGSVINVELSPYHLRYHRRAWYVLGYSNLHRSVRTFKLNRIKQLKTLDKCFIDGEKFDMSEHFGKAWSMIPEGKIYNIKLRFLPKVAGNVTEVHWHSTQKVRHDSDGSAVVEFRVDGLREITWWILGYGDQVQVLAPKVLRRKVVEAARNMITLNEQIETTTKQAAVCIT